MPTENNETPHLPMTGWSEDLFTLTPERLAGCEGKLVAIIINKQVIEVDHGELESAKRINGDSLVIAANDVQKFYEFRRSLKGANLELDCIGQLHAFQKLQSESPGGEEENGS